MKKIITLFFLILITLTSWSQQRVITGTVTDAQGSGIPGVTVLLVGTNTGTVTDIDGKYSISANQGILRYSFIGYATQEITIGTQNTIDVVLVEELTELNEVVVIGYGAQQRKDLTTAVAIVDAEAIRDRPIVSASQALQGKAAGVQVVQPSGEPGAGLSVRVRGATSVLAGNEPLYVVDGVPTTDVRGINPNDISSMSVLKDASSAAIYGARAANGVVLITTKRGEENTPLISFNAYGGSSNIRKTIDVLSTRQYRDLMNEISPGSIDPSITEFTNWPDSVFGTGITQSYQLSVSGGDENSKYFVSGGYLSEKGIVAPARFDRYSVRMNLDNQVKSWFKLTTSLSVISLNSKDTPDNLSSGRGGVIMSALNTPPFLKVYKDDESGWFDPNPFQPSWENPIAYMEGPNQASIDQQLFGSVSGNFTLLKGLSFMSRVGLDIKSHQWDYYLDPFRTNFGRNNNGIGRSDKSNANTWLWENTLDYTYKVDKHNLNALIGNSIQKYKYNDSYVEGNDFPEDVSVTTLWAANVITGGTSIEEWALASMFGRVAYDYNNRYYATVSIRRDGSSKLAQKWGTMPSFSLGWRISSESFMQGIKFIDDLKIRGGWGRNGNQEGIPNYARFGLVNYNRIPPTNPLSGPGSTRVTYGNPDLKWETTEQTNIGLDLTTLDARLIFTFDAYIKKTRDVLLNVRLSNTLPITTIQTNAGEIENRGIEFNINSVNIDKDFRWLTDFNIAFNKNEVTKLEYTDVYYFGRVYSNNQDVAVVREGMALGTFFGYVSEGVDPETGDIKYKDVNSNGIFDTGDRTVIGSGQPDFTFGLTNTFSYDRFDLSVFLQGSYGNDIFNATRIDLEGMFDSKNQSVDVLRRWTPENTVTDIPRAVGGGNVDNVRNSSRFVEDGSYIRLKSVTLSFRAIDSKSNIKQIKGLSVYVTGQNLLTLTNYSGFDPEVNAFGSSSTELGIDYGTYPQARSVIVGINIDL